MCVCMCVCVSHHSLTLHMLPSEPGEKQTKASQASDCVFRSPLLKHSKEVYDHHAITHAYTLFTSNVTQTDTYRCFCNLVEHIVIQSMFVPVYRISREERLSFLTEFEILTDPTFARLFSLTLM
jgi:hypothetical protein